VVRRLPKAIPNWALNPWVGFIAIHCVRVLLAQGHRVRGTVRSADKGEYIAELLGKRYPGRFEYVIVEDIEHEGAFDTAAQGTIQALHITMTC
jgi:nucleoside-diphosphate-sugar epimerase